MNRMILLGLFWAIVSENSACEIRTCTEIAFRDPRVDLYMFIEGNCIGVIPHAIQQ